MVYNKQTWTDLPSTASPFSAARMNVIEQGIADGDVTNPASPSAILQNATIAGAVAPKLDKAAAATTYASQRGSGVARFVARATAGAAVGIVYVGDSVTIGTGATLGTNDFATLVKNACAAQFPTATITQSNRGLSGSTVATNVINGYFANAIIDNGDLYVIMFGKNDTVADAYGVPVQGYPLTRSMRGLEVMIREVRRKSPQADIIIAAENPNTSTDTVGNANLQAWNVGARSLAAAYGCEWVDCYAAYTAKGNYATYLSDAVHPSVAGHQLIADTIMASVPATPTVTQAAGRPSTEGGIYAVADVQHATGYNGWVVRQAPGASQNGVWVNSGTFTGTNPFQSTTVGDYVEFTFVGTEFMLRMDTAAASALVVDVTVDGVVTQSNLSMSTVASAFQPFVLLASGLSLLQHKLRVTLKSGTFKVYQSAWLSTSLPQISPVARKTVGGRWLGQSGFIPATTAPAAGTATVVPFFVPLIRTATFMAVDITTLAAGATVELGVYGSDEFDQPLGLVLSAGTVDASTTGFKSLSLAMDARVLTPGWYWLAALSVGGAPAMRGNNGTSHELVSTAANSTAAALNGYTMPSLTALPTKWTGTAAGGVSPRVLIQFN